MLAGLSGCAACCCHGRAVSSCRSTPKNPEALANPPQGCTFVNQYVVIKTLGQGAYGKVKLCLNARDHNLYALKLISKVGSYAPVCPA